MVKLTKAQRADLHWLAKQRGLVWGGVYETGGDPDVPIMERSGLIERVSEPYCVSRIMFAGGYRITAAGRAALSDEVTR